MIPKLHDTAKSSPGSRIEIAAFVPMISTFIIFFGFGRMVWQTEGPHSKNFYTKNIFYYVER